MNLKETQKFWELETQVLKKQSLTYCSKSWKPLQKIWIWNLKKIILEAQKSITFKTKKTMNIGTTKSINNEVQKSRCLERYTPQSVWTKKHKPGDPNLQEPEPKKIWNFKLQ